MTLYDEVKALKPGTIFTVGPTGKIGYLRTGDGITDLLAVETIGGGEGEIWGVPEAWKALDIGLKVRYTHKGGWSTWTEG